MTLVYRLHSLKYPASSGTGAAIYGGRWNSVGTPVIYASSSPSLAALEILANYAVLPGGFGLTEIHIPDSVKIIELLTLPSGWTAPIYDPQVQAIGDQWCRGRWSAAFKLPSTIIGPQFTSERNFLLNPSHPDFRRIQFLAAKPFSFDSRLK